jgi:hypothetical protein
VTIAQEARISGRILRAKRRDFVLILQTFMAFYLAACGNASGCLPQA